MMNRLIIVGGFLGAGKTSLLWRAAELLKKDGVRVGLITNDQATNLVDTTLLEGNENLVREVSGSCFCCNFNGFADAIRYLAEKNDGGVTVAEPVGSCTDLSATLMQPLKKKFAEKVRLSPLTVLADPAHLRGILDGRAMASAYIGEKQFEEADIILINKSDLLTADEIADLKERTALKWPAAAVMTASVKDGSGVAEWLETVLAQQTAGTHLAEVDYDIYAAGEAAYGWLNATFAVDAAQVTEENAGKLLKGLANAFDSRGASVGHVKFLLKAPEKQWIGNLTGSAETAALRALSLTAEDTDLTVNARVEMGPDELQSIVLQTVTEVFGGCRQLALNCLIPGRPNPTYRYNEVVSQ